MRQIDVLLKFEHDNYENVKTELPKVGSHVMTTMGPGKVVGLKVDEHMVQVQLFEHHNKIWDMSPDDVVEQKRHLKDIAP